jgi:hypothetical protein
MFKISTPSTTWQYITGYKVWGINENFLELHFKDGKVAIIPIRDIIYIQEV